MQLRFGYDHIPASDKPKIEVRVLNQRMIKQQRINELENICWRLIIRWEKYLKSAWE